MKRTICFLLLALTLISCSHLKVVSYTDIVYPPTIKVEVFRTNKPERKYIEIAQFSINEGESSIKSLIEKAKDLGADGLIILETQSGDKVAVYNVLIDVKRINAIAIKFIE